MKKDEFRSLIEEYKGELKNISKNQKIKMMEIGRLLNFKMPENEWNYQACLNRFIEEIFTIGLDKIMLMLKDYFDGKGRVYTEYRYWGDEMVSSGDRFLMVSISRKVYNLGSIRNNESLKALYKGFEFVPFKEEAEGTWATLLKTYPALEDYLWEQFFELKNQSKKEQMSLISEMINKNNKEQAVLRDPQLRENRISELVQEEYNLDAQLSKITESLEEIEV